MTVTLHRGDCLDVLRGLPEASVDAVVTDPPYGLAFMGREWDRHPSPAAYRSWCEAWARECLRVLKPGGYLLAFGGTRTSHRLVSGVEDAGFVIRDALVWLYGSGFPKSLDIGKALDKAAGATGDYGEPKSAAHAGWIERGRMRGDEGHEGYQRPWMQDGEAVDRNARVYLPATDLARCWDGYGTALKPAHENVVMAQKPCTFAGERGTIVANLSRMEAQLWSLLPASAAERLSRSRPAAHAEASGSAPLTADERRSIQDGLFGQMDISRCVSALTTCLNIVWSWSAILAELCDQMSMSTTETASSLTIDLRILKSCLSGLTLPIIIRAAMHPDGSAFAALPAARSFNAVAAKLNATLTLSALAAATSTGPRLLLDAAGDSPAHEPIVLAQRPLDGTYAANVAKWGCGALDIDGCRVGTAEDRSRPSRTPNAIYGGGTGTSLTASQSHPAGRWPANVLLDDAAAAALDAQSGFSKSPGKVTRGGNRNQAFGMGRQEAVSCPADEGGASRFFYVAKASKRDRGEGNTHPTVKPTQLMQYLVRLACPPGGVVLDPFAGSGTTGVACVMEGRDAILIERDAAYLDIAARRIAAAEAARQLPLTAAAD